MPVKDDQVAGQEAVRYTVVMVTEQNYLDPQTLLQHLSLAPGLWVGDFGVGAGGHFAVPTARIVGPDGGVVLFDVVKAALSGAMSRAELSGLNNFKAVWTNLEVFEGAPGVADNTLDAGLLINVLHQSTKPQDILAEIHRMLKPGAKLLIADWKQEAQSTIAPPVERRSAVGYIEQLATSVGYSSLEKFDAGTYYWGLVVIKS